jgi:hypothetical protein
MSLVRVWTDVGERKPKALLARIISTSKKIYTISYLSPTDDKNQGRVIWRYEDETYEIDDDSICEYLDTDDETDIGFTTYEDGFIKKSDSDDDYVPSDEEDESTSEDDEVVEEVGSESETEENDEVYINE